jgi:hypothetical protein
MFRHSDCSGCGIYERMTRSQIRRFVEESSVERIREVLDLMQKVRNRVPPEQLPEKDRAFLLDLRDHEAFFRELADAKLQGS